MNEQQGFWRDAKPSDANKEPPMKARFSSTGNSNDWTEGELFDIVLIEDSEDYRLIYEAKKIGWHYCQVWEEYKKRDASIPKITTMDELAKEAEATEEILKQKVKVEHDGIFFPERDYWIELDRIQDQGDLLQWVLHLSEKVWVDTRMLARFVKLVCERKRWRIYRNASYFNL